MPLDIVLVVFYPRSCPIMGIKQPIRLLFHFLQAILRSKKIAQEGRLFLRKQEYCWCALYRTSTVHGLLREGFKNKKKCETWAFGFFFSFITFYLLGLDYSLYKDYKFIFLGSGPPCSRFLPWFLYGSLFLDCTILGWGLMLFSPGS